ncbi:MAG: cysteine desulfurase family protein [Verrucomicrobiota bacterium]|jgi:cysteine desulfurase
MSARRIYLDNSATTPLDPRVVQAMLPFLDSVFGNPSSLHQEGREAHECLDRARSQVAALLNADPGEIFFTASGTESDNLALTGIIEARGGSGNHIITSAIEHPAILETCRSHQKRGVEVTSLPSDSDGLIDPDELARAFRPTTRLVSIMTANNVVGTVQPINELARIARDHGVPFHTDAVQAAGRIPINVQTQPVDLLSLSAHKIYGPKGVGALFVRKGTPIAPIINGGGQERGLRSATENMAGIAGLGCAAEIASAEMSAEAARLVKLRDRIIETVPDLLPNAYLIGHRHRRLPGHVCLGFAGLEGESIRLLLSLDEAGIAVSTGSACSAHHAHQPSHVLQAMGFDPVRARGSLRVTLGRFNTDTDVEAFLRVLPKKIKELRSIATYPITSNNQGKHYESHCERPAGT